MIMHTVDMYAYKQLYVVSDIIVSRILPCNNSVRMCVIIRIRHARKAQRGTIAIPGCCLNHRQYTFY